MRGTGLRRAAACLLVVGGLLAPSTVAGIGQATAGAAAAAPTAATEALVGTAVGDPIELAATKPARVPGEVSVRLVVTSADDDHEVSADDVDVLMEKTPGSGQFAAAETRERNGVLVAWVADRAERSSAAATYRAHVAPLVRGDYDVSLLVVRGSSTDPGRFDDLGGLGDALVADSAKKVRASSRFDQIGLLPLGTEIVDVTSDGKRLVSTGGGYVDVSDPRNPQLLQSIQGVGTASVAIVADDHYALYVGNGKSLDVVDISVVPAVVVRRIELPGTADAVDTSADGKFAAAAFGPEGGDGGIAVVDTQDPDPAAWTVSPVRFDGDDPVFAGGTAAENVAFGPAPDDLIAGTFQSANAVAVVHPEDLRVVHAFSLGTVDDPFTGTPARLTPDGIAFHADGNLLTGNEGDTRSFSTFSPDGKRLFDTGREMMDLAARHGLDTGDPQVEEIETAAFPDGERFIFASMERTMSVAIYEASQSTAPVFSQFARLDSRVQPDGRPEGMKVVPQAGLVFVANEDDDSVSILKRTTDVRDGLPAPRQGIQPLSPATPWTIFQEIERLPDGTYLATAPGYSARQLGGMFRVRFDGQQAVVVDRLPLDVPDDDLRVAGAVGGATRDPKTGKLWVALDRPQARLALVGADGKLTRTIPLGSDGQGVTGLLADETGEHLYAVTSGRRFLTVDVASGQVTSVLWNQVFQSLFRLPDGGIGTTFGDGRNNLQVRRLVPGPAGGLAVALVADRPAGPFSGNQRFAANDVIPTGIPTSDRSDDGDAVVLWSNSGSNDGYTTRLVAVDGLLDASLDTAKATVSLGLASTPVTVTGNGQVTAQITTNKPGGVVFETRPAGGGDGDWRATAGTAPDGFGAGTVSRTFTAPVLDGTYDLRARFVSAAGVETITAPIAGGLVVDTPQPTSFALSSPTAGFTADAAPGGQFSASVQVNRAGTFELLAKPTGRPDSEYRALSVPGGNQLTGSATIGPVAPAAVPAVGTSLTYDLRLVFRAGGDGAPLTADQPGSLKVWPTGAATLMLVAPQPGQTSPAGRSVTATLQTDQPGSVSVSLVAPDGTTQPLTQQSVRAGNFNVSVNGTTLNVDGGWDLATRFTNLSGTVSDRTFTDAIVIATPQPEVHVVAPTADDPRTVPFYENRAVPVRFTKNGPGRIEFAVRKSGTNDEFVVVNDIPFTQPSRDREPGFVYTWSLASQGLAPGRNDLRVAFIDARGQRAEDISPRAVIGNDDPPAVRLMEPTTANPARSLPGAAVPTWATSNWTYRDFDIQVRPHGTSEWTTVPVRGSVDSSGGGFFTAPQEPGVYDVRYAITLPQDTPPGLAFYQEASALQVAADGPGARVRNPTTFHPVRLATGAQQTLRFYGVRQGAYLAQYRPAGSGDDNWVDIAPFTVATDEFVGVPFTVPANLPNGAYDLRAVAAGANPATGPDLQTAAIMVGPTPQARVVFSELDSDFFELRNVTSGPVDVGGWRLTKCSTNDSQLTTIPEGTVIAPGDTLWAGRPFLFPSETMPYADVAVAFTDTTGPGVALLDASGQLVDSVSLSAGTGDRCREIAPAPNFLPDDVSIHRDANGTDTGNNAADFTLGPPTPGTPG